MTMDEYLTLPCQYCGRRRSQHVGHAFVCFGGMGTLWHPKESILTTLASSEVERDVKSPVSGADQ